ncbi:MAG: uroporphyrinogen decarboxylase [Parvibaculaceae bacterium]|nr:uroporphyrinogen decarboxylase [Parvibaculaceae bacterium]
MAQSHIRPESAETGGLPQKSFLRALRGEVLPVPPVWLMRQAGRYLPEYRATREKAGSFLDLCYNPALAEEVTLQPIRRYGFDAAILFSDILVVPHGLGQKVWFEEGIGPLLDPITTEAGLAQLRPGLQRKRLEPVYETVSRLSHSLPAETALIGFAGAPWTVATYMVGGRSTADQAATRAWAYRDPAGFQKLIDILVEGTIDHLLAQIEAGAEAVQIFDTWAGALPEQEFARWVIEPTRKIVAALRASFPRVPVIGFPRNAGPRYPDYVEATSVDAVGLDTSMPCGWAREALGGKVTLQGNLDPLALVAGGEALRGAASAILDTMAGVPFIFNLGHGIVPQTPPEHITELVTLVREKR